MEERRGRRYKEGDYFGFEGAVGRNFLRKNRGRKVMEQRGKKAGGGG